VISGERLEGKSPNECPHRLSFLKTLSVVRRERR
jgi:hypothetical protein